MLPYKWCLSFIIDAIFISSDSACYIACVLPQVQRIKPFRLLYSNWASWISPVLLEVHYKTEFHVAPQEATIGWKKQTSRELKID